MRLYLQNSTVKIVCWYPVLPSMSGKATHRGKGVFVSQDSASLPLGWYNDDDNGFEKSNELFKGMKIANFWLAPLQGVIVSSLAVLLSSRTATFSKLEKL